MGIKSLQQPLDPAGDAVLLVGGADFVGDLLYFGDGVLHGDSPAAKFKHADVVKVVAKGRDFFLGNV